MAWFNSGDWTGTAAPYVYLSDLPEVLQEITTAIQQRYTAAVRGTLTWQLRTGYIQNPTASDFNYHYTFQVGYNGEEEEIPILVYITDKADALYDVSYGDDIGGTHDNMRAAYFKVQLPDLTGYEIVDAELQAYVTYNSNPGVLDVPAVYCDLAGNEPVGGWDESTSIANLEAMTFNGTVATSQVAPDDGSVTDSWQTINIFGDATKGIKKIYDDDPTAADPITIKFLDGTVSLSTPVTHTNPRVNETIEYRDRTNSITYWRVKIKYRDTAQSAVGGIIGQIRRAIESLLGYPTPIPGYPNYIRFYNFTDTAEWTLGSLLSKGSYGANWVTIDRIQNPDIWMQLQEALEELTYLREESPFSPATAQTKEFKVDGGSGSYPDITTFQNGLYSALAASALQMSAIQLYQHTEIVNTTTDQYTGTCEVATSYTAPSESFLSEGAFSSASIYYSEWRINRIQQGRVFQGYAGSHTVSDGDAVNYTFDPSSNGDRITSQNKDETWADACLAAGGKSNTWSISKPGANPCTIHEAFAGRDAGGDLIEDSGQQWIPEYFQINRDLSVGNGLTYG